MTTSKQGTARKPSGGKAASAPRKKTPPKEKISGRPEIAEAPYGALVGWASDDLGDRIRLRMQSTRTTPNSRADVEEFHYYIGKDQAAVLANFLFRVSGQTAPDRTMPAWLRKLLTSG